MLAEDGDVGGESGLPGWSLPWKQKSTGQGSDRPRKNTKTKTTTTQKHNKRKKLIKQYNKQKVLRECLPDVFCTCFLHVFATGLCFKSRRFAGSALPDHIRTTLHVVLHSRIGSLDGSRKNIHHHQLAHFFPLWIQKVCVGSLVVVPSLLHSV